LEDSFIVNELRVAILLLSIIAAPIAGMFFYERMKADILASHPPRVSRRTWVIFALVMGAIFLVMTLVGPNHGPVQ
jgi:hypothetical protein